MGIRIFDGIRGAGDSLLESGRLRWIKFPEHVIMEASLIGSPDSNAQSWNRLAAEMDQDRLQSIVTPGSS